MTVLYDTKDKTFLLDLLEGDSGGCRVKIKVYFSGNGFTIVGLSSESGLKFRFYD